MHLRSLIGAAVVVLAAFIAGSGGSPAPVSAVANIVVNSTADDTLANLAGNGKCDFREAIVAANTNAPVGNCPKGDVGADTITFNIDGPGPHTINLASTPLPVITQQVTIDGSTAESSTRCAAPRSLSIIIHGSPGSGDGITLGSNADFTIIRGLVINGFGGTGLVADSPTDVAIECNHIGTNREGTAAVPNGFGVTVGKDSKLGSGVDPVTGMNVVSGNTIRGVGVFGAAEVVGNYVGTNLAGTAAIPNGFGIEVASSTHPAKIGNSSQDGNLISGNSSAGVFIDGATSASISGNRIGTDAGGTGNLGNGGPGIAVVTETTRVTIVTNTFGVNSGPAIDLGYDGSTANDAGDIDTGPNLLQNYPNIASATPSVISANTNGFSSGSYLLEFFYSPTCDGARSPIGAVTDPVGPDTAVEFHGSDMYEPGLLPSTGFITATATFYQFNPTPLFYTSEFGPCVEITPDDPYDVDCDTDHDAVDVLAIMRFLAGLAGDPQPTEPCDADIDNDQDVDVADVVELRRIIALES